MIWNLFKGTVAMGAAALIAGCGAGVSPDAYTITVRADARTLPLNIAGYGPNIGGPYTTTLYVEAKDSNGEDIPGGEDVFQCSYAGGFAAGPLYYLDGDPEHETTETLDDGTEITTPNAYRAVVLGANSGHATFHFHASNVAETATIRCSVQDPSGTMRSAETTIQVGATPSGKVSQVLFTPFSPNYMFVQGMNGTTQKQLQLNLVDEAGQAVPSPAGGTNNIEISILSDATSLAEDDATLRGINATGAATAGSSIRARSINGQAQFSLVSGTHTGMIVVQAISDRYDNNVDNGITEPVFNLVPAWVIDEVPLVAEEPLTVITASLPDAARRVPYGAVLEAGGGVLPFTWSLASGSRLPNGLYISSSGAITGTPAEAQSGTFNFVVQVSDAAGSVVSKALSITYEVPEASVPTVATTSLSSCRVGTNCVVSVSATGGIAPYSWSAQFLPIGLSMNSSTGLISGTPGASTAGSHNITVTATSADGWASAPKVLTLVIDPASTLAISTTSPLPDGSNGLAYDQTLVATGGTAPYSWSIDSGSLVPCGITLLSAGGLTSGGAVAATCNFVAKVTDSDGNSQTRTYVLTIN